ncbi:hypothetical protein AB0I54_44735 [Streptomyces sp. NPDC050625]|uniref:hypothetical protein n=1 Tax=Streptomyces sp. NPDC050625 TaxID=3154629 RepID=UPI00341B8EC6
METNPTALLLELAAQAQSVCDPDGLHDLLSRGHRAWRKSVADVQAGVDRETASMSDDQFAKRCIAAGDQYPWHR